MTEFTLSNEKQTITPEQIAEIADWTKGDGGPRDFSVDPLSTMSYFAQGGRPGVQDFIKAGAEVSGGAWDFSGETDNARTAEKIIVPEPLDVWKQAHENAGVQAPEVDMLDVWDASDVAAKIIGKPEVEVIKERVMALGNIDEATKKQVELRLMNEAIVRRASQEVESSRNESSVKMKRGFARRILARVMK